MPVHLQQNAQSYVRQEVAQSIRDVLNAPNRAEVERLLKQRVKTYQATAPELASWMEDDVPEGLTVFAPSPAHRRRLRTSNLMERLSREIERRTRVATLFPNEASLLRLVSMDAE